MTTVDDLRQNVELPPDSIGRILEAALERGADFAEVYAEAALDTEIRFEQGAIRTIRSGSARGAGVRALAGAGTGYAHADSLSEGALLSAARAAGAIARGSARAPEALCRQMGIRAIRVVEPASEREVSARVGLVQRAVEAMHAADGRLVEGRVVWFDRARAFLVGNSLGVLAGDEDHLSRLVATAWLEAGGERSTGWAGTGGRVPFASLDAGAPETAGREAVRRAAAVLGAADPPAGDMPVVVGPGWGGVMIHECFGHSAEGDGIRRGTSIRAAQLGQRVAPDVATVVDDATLPGASGSYNVDGEGTPGRRNVILEHGIFRSCLLDLANARLMGMESTGNGRRGSYRFPPIPRLSNTYLERGDTPPEDLWRGIRRGFYARSLGGGSVDPVTESFHFVVQEGYLIEDGRPTRPVRGAVLVGNGVDALAAIEAVGTDLEFDLAVGTCGKEGQFVPVGVGQPSVRFRSLTVGGMGG